jgi:hypothetical protein
MEGDAAAWYISVLLRMAVWLMVTPLAACMVMGWGGGRLLDNVVHVLPAATEDWQTHEYIINYTYSTIIIYI